MCVLGKKQHFLAAQCVLIYALSRDDSFYTFVVLSFEEFTVIKLLLGGHWLPRDSQ